MRQVLSILVLMFLAWPVHSDTSMAAVTGEIERVNSMRESLVGAVQGKVDGNTFTAVCKPVGMTLKKYAEKNSVKVSQVSFKYRNKKHKPNPLQSQVLKEMENDKNLVSVWKQSKEGLHYFRRIEVKAACLNCHGSKDSRPDFIKKKYPDDKAFGFKAGDLRGAYSVFVPQK